MSRSFYYFGHDNLDMILVGEGKATRMNWGLMDHEGPIIQLDYIGYPEKRYAYLPEDLLSLLYKRFLAENPGGASLVLDDQYLAIARAEHAQDELDALYGNGKALRVLNIQQAEEGYPLMKKYLPELFEAGVVERIAADPWLDYLALRRAENLGVDKGGIPASPLAERALRWSPQWREYCDDLRDNPRGATPRRRRKGAKNETLGLRIRRWWKGLLGNKEAV